MLRLLLFTSILWGCASLDLPAQSPAVQAALEARPENRYLFIVDTSTAMARHSEAARQVVYDLVSSGMNGQMRPGDSFALWTYNDQNYAGHFPLQHWDPSERVMTGGRAAYFLKTQRFEKAAHPQAVISDLAGVLEAARDLTIYWITDGLTEFKGTPFDDLINAACFYKIRGMRRSSQPLVISLFAQDSKLASWAVTLANEPGAIPLTPPKPKKLVKIQPVEHAVEEPLPPAKPAVKPTPEKPEIPTKPTPAPVPEKVPATVKSATPLPSEPPPPQVPKPTPPVVVTPAPKPTVPEPKPELASEPSKPAPPSAIPAPAPTLPAKENLGLKATQPSMAPVPPSTRTEEPAPAKPALPSSVNRIQTPAPAKALAPLPAQQPPVVLPRPVATHNTVAAVPAGNTRNAFYLLAGLGFLALGAWLFYLHRQAKASVQPSIISDSINRKRN